MKLERTTVLKKLNWPNFYFLWPPYEYPWSERNKKIILLWLSTVYETPDELISDFKDEDLTDYQEDLEWLFPNSEAKNSWQKEIEKSKVHRLLNFSVNCLAKSLLWYNPDYHWQSGLRIALGLATRHLNFELSNEPKINDLDSSSFLGPSGWGDFGWVKHEEYYGDFIHIFYELLKICEKPREKRDFEEAKHIAHKSNRTLEFAVAEFWRNIKGTEEDQKLIIKENKWCDKIIVNDFKLSTQQISCKTKESTEFVPNR